MSLRCSYEKSRPDPWNTAAWRIINPIRCCTREEQPGGCYIQGPVGIYSYTHRASMKHSWNPRCNALRCAFTDACIGAIARGSSAALFFFFFFSSSFYARLLVSIIVYVIHFVVCICNQWNGESRHNDGRN